MTMGKVFGLLKTKRVGKKIYFKGITQMLTDCPALKITLTMTFMSQNVYQAFDIK